jgi:hypothetical protein
MDNIVSTLTEDEIVFCLNCMYDQSFFENILENGTENEKELACASALNNEFQKLLFELIDLDN